MNSDVEKAAGKGNVSLYQLRPALPDTFQSFGHAGLPLLGLFVACAVVDKAGRASTRFPDQWELLLSRMTSDWLESTVTGGF